MNDQFNKLDIEWFRDNGFVDEYSAQFKKNIDLMKLSRAVFNEGWKRALVQTQPPSKELPTAEQLEKIAIELSYERIDRDMEGNVDWNRGRRDDFALGFLEAFKWLVKNGKLSVDVKTESPSKSSETALVLRDDGDRERIAKHLFCIITGCEPHEFPIVTGKALDEFWANTAPEWQRQDFRNAVEELVAQGWRPVEALEVTSETNSKNPEETKGDKA